MKFWESDFSYCEVGFHERERDQPVYVYLGSNPVLSEVNVKTPIDGEGPASQDLAKTLGLIPH